MSISIFDFAWLIPLFPLLAFIIISLFTHRDRTLSQQIAVNGILLSATLALIVFLATVIAVAEGEQVPISTPPLNWFSLGGSVFQISVYIDPASAVMLSALPLICLAVFVHSASVLQENDPLHTRFFAILSLLAASMLGLFVFDNLLLFFIFWETMDACAYMLIGLQHERKPACEAALKTFLATKVGDLAFLLGLALLYAGTGSLAYGDVLDTEKAATVALLFLGGVTVKSAQFPLHIGLPEATAAPSPASALIHTAMASAGAFLLIRTFPLFDAAADSLLIPSLGASIVTLIGTVTAISAALIAVTQRDVQYALSFSIVGQLGYAVAALGMGAYVAGVFHLVASVFFNALLLLAAGSVTRGMMRGHQDAPGDEPFDPNDMFNMGGLGNRQPTTFWLFLIGGIALSGLPLVTAGFWSKDAILAQAWAKNQTVFWVMALATGITTFSMMRQLCLIFVGEPHSLAAAHAQESTPAARAPLTILAILTLALGWANAPAHFPAAGGVIPKWLEAFLGVKDAAPDFMWEPTTLWGTFSVSGLALGFLVYAWKPMQIGEMDRIESAMRKMWLGWLYRCMHNRFYLDRLYRWVFAKPPVGLGGALAVLDRNVPDGLMNGIAWLGQRVPSAFEWLDVHILDALVGLIGPFGKGLSYASNIVEQSLDRLGWLIGHISKSLSRVSNWFDARIDMLVSLTSRATKSLAHASDALDPRLNQFVNLTKTSTLALAKLSGVADRELDSATDRVGSAVKISGLWFRPRTGRVQTYLLLASIALLVLIAIFLFLFLQT